jgi:hypothetical protein
MDSCAKQLERGKYLLHQLGAIIVGQSEIASDSSSPIRFIQENGVIGRYAAAINKTLPLLPPEGASLC